MSKNNGTWYYVYYQSNGEIAAKPVGNKSAQDIQQATGNRNFYGVEARNPQEAIQLALDDGFEDSDLTDLITECDSLAQRSEAVFESVSAHRYGSLSLTEEIPIERREQAFSFMLDCLKDMILDDEIN